MGRLVQITRIQDQKGERKAICFFRPGKLKLFNEKRLLCGKAGEDWRVMTSISKVNGDKICPASGFFGSIALLHTLNQKLGTEIRLLRNDEVPGFLERVKRVVEIQRKIYRGLDEEREPNEAERKLMEHFEKEDRMLREEFGEGWGGQWQFIESYPRPESYRRYLELEYSFASGALIATGAGARLGNEIAFQNHERSVLSIIAPDARKDLGDFRVVLPTKNFKGEICDILIPELRPSDIHIDRSGREIFLDIDESRMVGIAEMDLLLHRFFIAEGVGKSGSLMFQKAMPAAYIGPLAFSLEENRPIANFHPMSHLQVIVEASGSDLEKIERAERPVPKSMN